MTPHPAAASLDPMATRLFRKAIADGQCGDLLAHLFDGDGVTIDAITGEIVYLPADAIVDLASGTDR